MARLLSKVSNLISATKPKQELLIFRRFVSRKASSAEIIEIDLGSSSSSSFDPDAEAVMMKKMEDLIQRIIVQRSTPDWLPFMPGSSFWVPPGNQSRPGNLDDLFSKLRGSGDAQMMMMMPFTDEQQIACFTQRGWPCPDFQDDHQPQDALFHQDGSSPPQDIEVTLEVKVLSADDEDK